MIGAIRLWNLDENINKVFRFKKKKKDYKLEWILKYITFGKF